jgi:hypothetical protein
MYPLCTHELSTVGYATTNDATTNDATTNTFYQYNQDATTNAEDLKEVLSCWNKLSKLMKDYHPDIAAVEMDLNHFNDTLMANFWRVQNPG